MGLRPCADLVEMIEARRAVTGDRPLAFFVVSLAIKNTKLGGEVAAALKEYGLPVFKSGTTQRVVYPTTASEGRTVLLPMLNLNVPCVHLRASRRHWTY